LIVEDSVTHIFNITDSIGVVMTGNMNDAKSIVTRLRYFAAEFKFKQGYHIPIQVLAQKLSEWSQ